MNTYRVTYETRHRDSIGAFWPTEIDVKAADENDARMVAVYTLHKQGYETRFPVSVLPLVAA